MTSRGRKPKIGDVLSKGMQLPVPEELVPALQKVISEVEIGMSTEHARIVVHAAELLADLKGLYPMRGEELQQERKKLRISQADLAETFGVARFSVNRWETGFSPVPRWLTPVVEALKKQRRVD